MTATISVALAGNPNSGKTTLFNVITGARHHVGNWPGKTVERRSGTIRHDTYDLDIVDLPGAYSLSATSPEEILARDYLIDERPDVVVIVVDASHLERNLFLATQILEFGTRAVLALNMTDVAAAAGITLDLDTLATRLGVPVVPLSASKRMGIENLLDTIVEVGRRAAA
jgi:ferrous iron transport protein B